MSRRMLMVAAVVMAGCNKGGDSGKTAEVPATCDDFLTALSECYATAGFDLADGGIDVDSWCAVEAEAGVSSDVYACRLQVIRSGNCSTADGVATTSEQLSACDPQ